MLILFGYRATSLVAPLALCAALVGVACGEDRPLVLNDLSHRRRGDEQPGLSHREGTHQHAAPVAGASRHRISAAVPGGQVDFGQHQRRRAQSGCEETSAVSVSSSLSSDYEGCYFRAEVEFGDDGEYEVVYTSSGTPEAGQMWFHPDGVTLNGIDLQGTYWWLSYVTSVDGNAAVGGDHFCYSVGQTATLYHHPADVTSWSCATGTVSASELSTTCGGSCSDSPTPTEPSPTPTPEPAAEAPEPSSEAGDLEPTDLTSSSSDGSCTETSPVSVTSSLSSQYEGCYLRTELEGPDDGFYELAYTPSGSPEAGQMWFHKDGAIYNGEEVEGVYWWLSYITGVDGYVLEGDGFCFSLGQSTALYEHPSDVTSWTCLDGIGTVTAAELSVACGCSGSPTPSEPEPSPSSTSERDAGIPEPTEAGDSEPTDLTSSSPDGSCAETSPFWLSSSLSSDYQGCYYRAEAPSADGYYELIYTATGTPEVGQLWMHPDGVTIDGVALQGTYWWLSYVTAVDEYAQATADYLCYSRGQTVTLYEHPADVTSWECVTGTVSASEFSTTCGCSGSATSAETPELTEAPAPEPADGDIDRFLPTAAPTPTALGDMDPLPEPTEEEEPTPSPATFFLDTSSVPTPSPTSSVPTFPPAAGVIPTAPPGGESDGVEPLLPLASAGYRWAAWSVFHLGITSVVTAMFFMHAVVF